MTESHGEHEHLHADGTTHDHPHDPGHHDTDETIEHHTHAHTHEDGEDHTHEHGADHHH